MVKLDHAKDKVVKMLAVEPQTSIAVAMDVDQSTVSRFASRSEIKKLVEVEKEKLVKVLPDAVQNVKDLVEEMKGIPKDDIKRRELSYKASKDVLKATNVFPSPQYAQNIYNDNRIQQNIAIKSSIAKFMGEAATRQIEALLEEEEGL